MQVAYGDECRVFPRHSRLGRVEHVRVRIDQAGQNRGLAQVDHLSSGRYLDLSLRSDVSDSLALKKHNLPGQHLASLAVEQAAGADRYHSRSWRALNNAAVRSHTRCRARPTPGSGWRLNLRRKR